MSVRDLPAPSVIPLLARMLRPFANFRDTFVYFVLAVPVVTALGKAKATSALGAQIYF